MLKVTSHEVNQLVLTVLSSFSTNNFLNKHG